MSEGLRVLLLAAVMLAAGIALAAWPLLGDLAVSQGDSGVSVAK